MKIHYDKPEFRDMNIIPSLLKNGFSYFRIDGRAITTRIAQDECTFFYREQSIRLIGAAHLNAKVRLCTAHFVTPWKTKKMDHFNEVQWTRSKQECRKLQQFIKDVA